MATIDWQPAIVPPKGIQYIPPGESPPSFVTLLYNFLVPLEVSNETELLNLTSVITSKGQADLTIGVGFDLLAGGPSVQAAVLEELGFVPSVITQAISGQPPNSTDPNFDEEYTYVQRLLGDIQDAALGGQAAQNAIADVNQAMAARYAALGTSAAPTAFGQFVSANKLSKATEHNQFAFNGDSEVYSVFQNLWTNVYQNEILAIIPPQEQTGFSGSREEMALFDLLWNGGPGLLGTGLQNAISDGNRAQAWFEIRYKSNLSKNDVAAERRYYDAQVFGLYDNPSAPTQAEALQAYQMLTANRSTIMSYEFQFGADPYGSSAITAAGEIAAANSSYGLNGTPEQVQTLAQVFDTAANEEIQYLSGLYSGVLPAIAVNDTGSSLSTGFNLRSVDIFAASPTDRLVYAGVSDAPTATEALADASADHLLVGSETGDTLIGAGGDDILASQAGNESLIAGAGSDTLIADAGNDTIQAAGTSDVMDFVFPSGSSGYKETVEMNGGSGAGALDVNGSQIGASLNYIGNDTWLGDGDTFTYIANPTNLPVGYSPGAGAPNVGELQIQVGGQGGNEIDIWGFNLSTAEYSPSGFLGIKMGATITLTASATAGVDPPAPDFTTGSTQSYTVSVDAPSTAAQIVTVALSGADAADFEAQVGSQTEALNSNGSFTVTLPAGQTAVSFSLANIADVNGNASLQLVASITNPADPTGKAITSTPLTQSYVESTPDPFSNSGLTDVTGSPETDPTTGLTVTVYEGSDAAAQPDHFILSGADNYVDEGTENNLITETAPGNSVIFGGGFSPSGTILLNGASTLTDAITQVESNPAASGQRGDLVATASGNDTLVGGDGNSAYLVGGCGFRWPWSPITS